MKPEAERIYQRYPTLFRYAGNRKGWHVCIRCDGHLHIDQHLAIVGVGEYIYGVAIGAQDFTDQMTILTHGRPHGMSPEVLEQVHRRGINIIETKIKAHIGEKTDLLGFEMEDGSTLYFDGFFVDEGLQANTAFLAAWNYQKDDEGLIIINEDAQLLDASGVPIPGLFAAGDIVSGTRNLIATAFALGQNAGLSASDTLRKWHSPKK
ncbi:NAD(P)/FAD-dependent oxidoreductase [Candidatus Poribacteria bacterium]|nr:NAD(P)/FAD-dependent oxidoreductase [Candidatus Poribacteria bacterium]